jgi:hypothetical protein
MQPGGKPSLGFGTEVDELSGETTNSATGRLLLTTGHLARVTGRTLDAIHAINALGSDAGGRTSWPSVGDAQVLGGLGGCHHRDLADSMAGHPQLEQQKQSIRPTV